MSESGPLDMEISRLDGALVALQAASESASERARTPSAAQDNSEHEEALSAAHAERDLIKLKHRRLVQETETALGDLERLIADRGAR
ncbi:MAG: hypothetical protein WA979_11545 [Pacificimonas sp.]